MRKKDFKYLGAQIILVFLILLLLVQFSNLPNTEKNGFFRHWLPSAIEPLNKIKIKSPLKQICGATKEHIFLSVPNPQWLVMMDQYLQRVDTIYFPVTPSEKLQTGHSFEVDSPRIYLHANNIPEIFYASLDSGKLKSKKLLTSIFTKSVQISFNTMVVRAFDSSRQQIFEKINCLSGEANVSAKIIPQGKYDMGFPTDGFLQYDKSSNRLVFVEFYQNKFYCIDTSLNLMYLAKTIDTTNSNNVSIQSIKVDTTDMVMPSKARVTVNRLCSTSDGNLFIVSGLKADNENETDFKNNDVIDVYRIKDGGYIGSFYIPVIEGDKIRSFFMANNRAFVLYNTHVASFRINI